MPLETKTFKESVNSALDSIGEGPMNDDETVEFKRRKLKEYLEKRAQAAKADDEKSYESHNARVKYWSDELLEREKQGPAHVKTGNILNQAQSRPLGMR